MGDSIADLAGRNELPYFVKNRSNGLILELGVHLIELIAPEINQSLIL